MSDSKQLEMSGRYGLINLGNSCYMNAALQSIVHSREIVELFANYNINQKIETRSMNGQSKQIIQHGQDEEILRFNVLYNFISFVKAMWSIDSDQSKLVRGSVLNLKELKSDFGVLYPDFSNCFQHDCHEYITYLLDSLHQSMNKVKKKTSSKVSLSASSYMNIHTKLNDSPIIDLFYGEFKSSTKCMQCKTETCSYEPFSSLGLSIPLEFKIQLYVIARSGSFKLNLHVNEEMKFGQLVPDIEQLIEENIKGEVTFYFVLNSHIVRIASKTEKIGNMSERESFIFVVIECSKKKSQLLSENNNQRFCFVYNFGFSHKQVSSKELDEVDFNLLSFPRLLKMRSDISPSELLASLNKIIKNYDCNLATNSNLLLKALLKRENDSCVFICFLCMKRHSRQFYCGCINTHQSSTTGFYLYDCYLSITDKVESISDSKIEAVIICEGSSLDIRKLNLCKDLTSKALDKRSIDLEDLLSQFTTIEKLTNYNCVECTKKVDAEKRMEISRFPRILVIQLKRFTFNKAKQSQRKDKKSSASDFIWQKKENKINFKEKIDMTKYSTKQKEIMFGSVNQDYSLFSVCNHYGSISVGHYSSISKHHITKEWIEFDDKIVRIYEDDLVTNSAYLLFYSKSEL